MKRRSFFIALAGLVAAPALVEYIKSKPKMLIGIWNIPDIDIEMTNTPIVPKLRRLRCSRCREEFSDTDHINHFASFPKGLRHRFLHDRCLPFEGHVSDHMAFTAGDMS